MKLRCNNADVCIAVLVLVFRIVMLLITTAHKLQLRMSVLQMKSRWWVRGVSTKVRNFMTIHENFFWHFSLHQNITHKPWLLLKSVSALHNWLLSSHLSSLGSVSRNCTSGGWSRPFPPYHVACNVDDDIPEVRVAEARQLGMSDWGMWD